MNQTKIEPKSDLFAKAYFLLEGVGTLISWNAVLNGLDYFSNKYPQFDTNFLLPIAVNGAQVLCCFFMPYFSSQLKLKYRIIAPLVTLSLILVFLPVEANLLSGSNTGFWLIMLLLFILGFANNVFQGSMSGFVGQFPGKYTSYFLMGTGLAGVIMNGLRALAIVGLANVQGGELTEIIAYFVVAGLILMACVVIHPFFVKSEFHRYYHGPGAKEAESALLREEQSYSMLPVRDVSLIVNKRSLKDMFMVFKDVYFYVLLLVLNYVISFLVFPGVMLEKPMGSLSADWQVVSMLATFNFFDVVGKNIAQHRHLYTKWGVFVLTLSRLIFDGFFIVQAVTSSIVVFNTIWFGYVNIALFGVTNGFVTTALFIMGPEQVEGEKKEVAGFLSVFGLVTGLTVGGFLALPLAHLNAHNK